MVILSEVTEKKYVEDRCHALDCKISNCARCAAMSAMPSWAPVRHTSL